MHLANTLLDDGESARDNHVLACNFDIHTYMYIQIYIATKIVRTSPMRNSPHLCLATRPDNNNSFSRLFKSKQARQNFPAPFDMWPETRHFVEYNALGKLNSNDECRELLCYVADLPTISRLTAVVYFQTCRRLKLD